MTSAGKIEATAAKWLLRREEPGWSETDEAQLREWLSESAAHKAAYWRLKHGWHAADRIAALGSTAVAAQSGPRTAWPKWQRYAIAAAFAGLLFIVPAALRFAPPTEGSALPAAHYQTPLGGHERVALVDGSMVELNTATVIRAAVTAKQRDVWLDSGEAFFSVKHLGVPFVVHAGPRLVTVLGTKFSVRRDGNDVRVAVIEGKVRISDVNTDEPTPTTTIIGGDMLHAVGDSTLVVQNAEPKVEQSLAWRDGMLQFDQTPLAQAAAEFNRYNEHKLVVTGQAAIIPIGGSFKASNEQAFARLLHDAYGLQIKATPSETKISD